ncbi:hypothetical protein MTO96_051373 [Rhipicephalus appendiculatus]
MRKDSASNLQHYFRREPFRPAISLPIFAESPKIQPFSFPKNPPVGKDVTVTCFATEGALPLTFEWMKDGKRLTGGSKFAVKNPLEKMSTLIVHEVSGADVGNYSCRVSNEAGNDVFTAGLVVTESPKIQPFSFPKNPPVGKDVTVTCFATEGALPLTFEWMKDGKRLTGGSKFTVKNPLDKMSTLIVHGVSGADVGNYSCRVSNEAGNDVFTAGLVVTGLLVGVLVNHGLAVFAENRGDTRDLSFLNALYTERASLLATERVRRDALSGAQHSSFPPEIQPFAFSRNTALGQRASVACVVIGGAEPFRFAWSHNNRPVSGVSGNEAATKSVHHQARGFEMHLCHFVVVAFVAHAVTSPALSSSVEAPQIQPFAFPKDPRANSKIVVSCSAHIGTEPITFAWFKNGQRVITGAKVQVKAFSETCQSDFLYLGPVPPDGAACPLESNVTLAFSLTTSLESRTFVETAKHYQ